MSFTKLGLNDALLKAVEKEGFTIPTPIQEQAIPVLLSGKDVLGTAQTGTGKTAAFALPMIQLLMTLPRPEKRVVRALIVVPTRELAVQIQEHFMQLSRFSNLRIGMFFGGVSKFGQVNLLRQGVDIAVATPGRLLDLMRDRAFHPNYIKMVVLDEADQMLDMGFLPDVKTILQSIPKPRQAALFSATMPEQIANLASNFLLDPVRISITPVSQPLNKIAHQTIKIEKNQKLSLLIHLLKNPELKSVLIFMRTKRGAKRTALNLTHQGHTVVELHGNQSQAQRQFAMKKFKEKHVRILVATDLASRGIDIHQLTHVVNFDMPETAEAFLHRTGRTGRAGFSGDVINLVSREESSLLHMINRHTGMSLSPSILKDFVFDSSLVIHGGGDDEGDRPRFQSRERSGQRSYGSPRSSGRGYGASQTPRSYGNPVSLETDATKPNEGERAPRRYESRSSSSGPRSSNYQGRTPRQPGQSSGYQGRTPREPGQSSGYQGRTPREPGQSSGYQGRTPREPGQSSGYQGRTPREPGQSSGYQGRTPREEGKSSNYEGKRPSYQSRNNPFKKRNP
jgi:ATP-dependent RNA helicase RhlE